MRTEAEMYRLILDYARLDERVRGVILNGSRADPQAPLDRLRDFDIVYLVTDVTPYKQGDISGAFGDILVLSRTDEVALFDEHLPHCAAYLMQFSDGNRIDLTIARREDFSGYCFDDRLSMVLLDKDGFLPELPPPDRSSHFIRRPSRRCFEECRTEFWWTALYVEKALYRNQLLYAQTHLELCTRKMLLQMLSWYAGAAHGFAVSAGKLGDGLKELLPEPLWKGFCGLYPPCEAEAIRSALYAAFSLFTTVSQAVAEQLSFPFDGTPDRRVPDFLRTVYPQVAALPPEKSWDGAAAAYEALRQPLQKEKNER